MRRLAKVIDDPAFAWRWGMYAVLGKACTHLTFTTPQGRFKAYAGDTAVSRALYVTKDYEFAWTKAAINWLRVGRHIPFNPHAIELGGNIGTTSVTMIKHCNVEKVTSFEPCRENYALLRHNLKLNGIDAAQVQLNTHAVGKENGLGVLKMLHKDGDHHVVPSTGEGECRTVPLCTAEHACEIAFKSHGRRPDFLWMDIQGNECAVLETLGEPMPIVTEIYPAALERAGVSFIEFQAAASRWDHFTFMQKDGRTMISYPTSILAEFIRDVQTGNRKLGGQYVNVILS